MENGKTVFFEIKFNAFFDMGGSCRNEVTDREEWQTCECALCLPDSYSECGAETPLILSCHGAGGIVSKEKGEIGGISYAKECLKQGYAVLDVCGAKPHGTTMGCPEHIFALHKAYLYATEHYHLSKRVLVAGASMGGQVAINFAQTFPSIVLAVGVFYPRLNIGGVTVDGHYCIGTWDKTQRNPSTGRTTRELVAENFRFPENEWCEENLVGFHSYQTRSVIGADGKRAVLFPCPIKVWQGLEDTVVDPVMAKEFVDSIRRAGCFAQLRCLEGMGHQTNSVMEAELVMWFNRFV